VRKAAGIEFAGWDPTVSALIAQVEMTELPTMGIRHDALGVHSFGRLEYEIRNGEIIYKDAAPSAAGSPVCRTHTQTATCCIRSRVASVSLPLRIFPSNTTSIDCPPHRSDAGWDPCVGGNLS
jgi:hypothetical protein